MKNLFKVLFVAAVATAFVACNKEIENQTPETPGVRTVQFSTAPITKTVFGTASGTSLPTLWTENKTVGISLNFATAKQSTAPQVAGGGTTATFKADIDDSGSSPYTFYAVSPYSSLISVSSDYKSANINIPSSQTPLATSVDESAQILVAKNSVGESFPTSSVSMDFEHFTAYGKISFKNLTLADGETIASVSLTAPKNWVGRYHYYFEDNGTNEAGDIVANSASATITIATSSSTNIWFACAPVDLRGEDVDVVITTNQGTTYSKTITIPTDATGDKHLFKSGKVNAFTINMEGITADGAVDYVLVTNASDLAVGNQVIIAGLGDVDYALSTTQNQNNRAAIAQAKSADDQTISSPGAAVQILTIAEGNKANTIAFSTGSGYLCAASSGSNYLRTQETLDDEGSWTVEINSTTGEATIIAQGTYTRNYIRYNPNSGNPIFSCYASSPSLSTTGSPVAIYMYDPTTWNLSSIAVTTPPTKTEYEAGEDFDATGMVVSAHYVDAADNTHTKDVVIDNSSLIISPSTNLTAGTTSVSISFAGQSTTQAITVSAPITWDLNSIAVTTAPTKTTYTVGETFDPTGMVVTATYENHDNTEQTKQEVVDNGDLTFSPTTDTALETSNTSVSISYTEGEITKSATQAITVTEPGLVDILNNSWTGISGTSYSAKSDLAGSDSDAVYSVQAAGGNSSIQLRNQSPSGIVSTVSGGTLKSISVKWNSNTNNERTLAVYAKNTAYTGPSDLYDNSSKGTLVHTFAKSDGDASWTFDSDYEYIGLLASGALYLDEIDIEWKTVTWNLSSIAVTTPPTKTEYEAGEDFDATGMVVSAHYVDAADNTHTKDVVIDNSSLIISPSTNLTAGTTSVSISFAGQSTTQAITVTAPITWDLKSIAVTTEPTKTTYTEGEYFDPAGLVVTATYENHDNTEQTKQEVIDNGDLTFSPTTSTPLTTSDESVLITYGGKSTTQAITVNAASATAYYVKVTSELNDWSGQYLFVFETNNVAFDGSLEDLDSTPNTFEVSISDSKIASSAAIDAKSFTIASVTGGYSIQAATGKYIGRSANSNGMDKSDDALVNTISWSNSQPLVAGSGGRKLGFNNDSNQKKFRYLGSPSAIQLYKLEDNTTWNLSSIAVTTAPTKTTYEAGEDFDATGMEVTAHYVDAADNTHTKDVVLDNGDLTINPSTSLTAGTTSVTISYGGRSTTQAITVSAAKVWDLKSIAVKTAPTKTTYTEGEYFDPAGLVITPTYENRANTAETKTGADVAYSNDTAASFSFAPTTSTALETSNTSVSISYTEGGITESTTQTIIVDEENETHYYVKVTSTDDISNGDYLIVYESGDVAFNGGLSSFDATSNTIAVSITTNGIEATSTVNAAKFTINSMTGGYSIMGASGKYITVNSYANGLATSTSAAANGIAFDSNGNVQITVSLSGGTMTLKYNSASNQNRFRYFKSGQQNIQLYKLN